VHYALYAVTCLPGGWGTTGQVYKSNNYYWVQLSFDKNINPNMYYAGFNGTCV